MHTLIIINDPAYGTERAFNALRLGHALQRQSPDNTLTVFLMGDAVVAAHKGQKTPNGYYNLEHMVGKVLRGNGRVLLCGVCMDARGYGDEDMVEGSARSSMDELAEITAVADRTLVF